jgi:hypothetical protein
MGEHTTSGAVVVARAARTTPDRDTERPPRGVRPTIEASGTPTERATVGGTGALPDAYDRPSPCISEAIAITVTIRRLVRDRFTGYRWGRADDVRTHCLPHRER